MDRLKQKLLSSSTGEGAIRARPSDLYAIRKAALVDEQIRLALDLVEEGIAVDPAHRAMRQQVGEVIWDKSEPGVAVAFAVQDDAIVYLTFVLLWER